MLGSVFLGFPQTQDVVSSLTSAVLQVSQRTCRLRVPSSHQHFMAKWQTPEALQKPVVLMKLTSQWSWKEGKWAALPWLLWIQLLRQLVPGSLLYSGHKAEGQSWFCLLLLSTPCRSQKHFSPCSLLCFFSLSPSLLHLYVTSLREPPRKPRHSHHSRRISLLLYFPLVWLLLFVELLSSPLHSQTQVCDPDLRNGHP